MAEKKMRLVKLICGQEKTKYKGLYHLIIKYKSEDGLTIIIDKSRRESPFLIKRCPKEATLNEIMIIFEMIKIDKPINY